MLPSIARKRLERIRAEQATGPRSIDEHWTPNPGPQRSFFESECREILYGGAAGGGKSSALIALALKWAHLKGFEAVVLRREAVQLDDLIQKSKELYRQVYPGIEPIHSPHFEYTFPSGAKAKYRHCQRERDYAKYDGWEINLLCFDELTHFTERQYKYICARVRSADPRLPRYIRATTNPGGEGHEWVFRHWGAWLDPEFMADGLEPRFSESGERLPPACPGEIWWIRTDPDGNEHYFRECPPTESGQPPALSRTFIPAKLEDNPHLEKNDPEYVAQLNALDPVRRAQLKSGDWLIRPARGLYFRRSWVTFVDEPPSSVLRRVRAWDLAGTEKKDAKDDPDWTVGVRMSIASDGRICIEDVVRFRGNPGQVKKEIQATAEIDGVETTVFLPQDPGQAGKAQVYDLRKSLLGYIVKSRPVTGDKVQRFGPFSSQAEGEMVSIVRGAWNAQYIGELEAFPEGTHDDCVDATSDAFRMIGKVNKMFAALAGN